MLYQTKNPHGGDIYQGEIRLDYSANTNPYGTPPGVIEAVSAALAQIHHYPDPYCRELTAAIAAHEAVPEEYILCGNGAAELIYSWCRAVSPRCAAELAPTFAEYSLGLGLTDARVTRFYLRQEDDFLPDARLASFLEGTRPDALILCNPNNPTGQLMSQTLLLQILELCRKHNIRVLLDECFMDLTGQAQSMVKYLSSFPNLLILKAFTKSYGMAGIRLGYCMSADSALLSQMAQSVQPWNVSTLAQKAGVAALKEKAFLENTVQTVKAQRDWLSRQLRECGFRVCPGSANYILFRGPEGLDTALRQRGIAIRSCDNYHGLGAGWYRIAVRLPRENAELMEAIRQEIGGK